ncbi:MAG: cyanophycinase, partial [Pirellulales bacterium]
HSPAADEPTPQRSAATQAPAATQGSLVICGGGSLPAKVLEQFVELAGGSQGRLVVIPTAGSDKDADEADDIIRYWTELGLGSVSVLHTRDRQQADSAAFVAPLGTATAIWFGGGQQSRLADCYLGTATEQAIVELFRRGGVIGGTSAGAAIQSRVMIESGNPVPKVTTGLDLLPGSIVDQHFLRRDRFNRLLKAVREHPDCVGVGIDEATAVVFRRGECRVLGVSFVTVVRADAGPASLSVHTYRAGQTFRLTDMQQSTSSD